MERKPDRIYLHSAGNTNVMGFFGSKHFGREAQSAGILLLTSAADAIETIEFELTVLDGYHRQIDAATGRKWYDAIYW